MRRGRKDDRPGVLQSVAGIAPPTSIISERLAIAALYEPYDIKPEDIAAAIRPEYFTNANREKIYRAWFELYKAGEDCSAVSVIAKLARTGSPQISLRDLRDDYIASSAPCLRNFLAAAKELNRTHRLRIAAHTLHAALSELYHGQEVDPSAFSSRLTRDISEACEAAGEKVEATSQILKEELKRLMEGPKPDDKLKTGLTAIDSEMGGVSPGDLVVIGGRPGMGKSALGMNVAENILLAGMGALIVSLEMPARQLLQRVISGRMKINLRDYKDCAFPESKKPFVYGELNKFSQLHCRIDDRSNQTVFDVRQSALEFKKHLESKGVKLGCVVVDYIQLLKPAEKADRRDLEIAEQSRELKALAKDLECPVFALAQLNRGAENRDSKKPGLTDLRESGSIENDADSVLLLYREDYYKRDGVKKNEATLIVAKNRSGPIGEHKLKFTPEFTRFDNPDDEIYRVNGFNDMGRR